MNWWIADLLRDDPALLVSWVVWVIGSIVLHELAHGWAAIWQGDNTPRELGHMTWNPLVHMGGWSLAMFAIVGIAWGAMPVNPSRFRGRYGNAMVALAGPAMNLMLAAVAVVLGSLWNGYGQDVSNPLWRNFMVFFIAGSFLNVALAIFNLLPFPPLDGSRILADFVPSYRRLIEQPKVAAIGIIILIVVFSRGGSVIFDASRDASTAAFDAVASVLPGSKPYLGPFKTSDMLNDPEVRRLLDESQTEQAGEP